MKTRNLSLIASGLFLAACVGSAEDVSLQSRSPHRASLVVEPPLTTAVVETSWRFIGTKVLSDDECPKPASGHFEVRQLFGDSSTAPNDLPPALRRYCLYETKLGSIKDTTAPPELTALLGPLTLEVVEPDIAAVGAHASLRDINNPRLRKEFDEHTGRVHMFPAVSQSTPTLVLADTLMTQDANGDHDMDRGNSWHGFGLWQMARQLLCNDHGCLGFGRSELAMPYRNTSSGVVVDPMGGAFGTISGLSEVVYRSVQESGERLVLNLSLAWDPRYGQGTFVHPSVASAKDALAYARCQGAVIIAASGNSVGGSASSGPLLPAAWSELEAPNEVECATEYEGSVFPSVLPSVFNGRPLVFSVSGVDGRGQDLANAQRLSRAPIVAHGDRGVGDDRLDAMTGSSVSCLVVSSIATILLALEPDLSAEDVMGLAYGSGSPVGYADYEYVSSVPMESRRVTVCDTLAHYCDAFGNCDEKPECSVWKRNLPEEPAQEMDKLFAGKVIDAPNTLPPTQLADCGARILHADDPSILSSTPCPDLQFYNQLAMPWTDPQPNEPRCPNCFASGIRSRLFLESATPLSSSSILGLTVSSAGSSSNYGLSTINWPPQTHQAVISLPPGVLIGADTIRVDMNVNGTFTSVPIGLSN
ncbi:MAG: hypothetical protein AAFU77_04405 [Myxococcota bacterium]